MSIDSYYCFCCLSTTDLTCLFDNVGNIYVQMLEYMFSFKPFQEDTECDGYICAECCHCLEAAHRFKTRVFRTLDILQKQGLIELHKIGGELVIKKCSHSSTADAECDRDNKTANASIAHAECDRDNKTAHVSTADAECDRDCKTDIIDKTDVFDVMNALVDVKFEHDDLDSPRTKPLNTVTSIITQPMVKVTVGPTEYDVHIGAAGTDAKEQPVHVAEDQQQNTKNETQIKNEPEKDANIESNETIKSDQDKTEHLQITTNINKIKSYEVPKDLICKVCMKQLPNVYVYHTHMNEHMPHHICETCGKGFPNRVKLRRHMYSHQAGPFVCASCGDSFSNYNTYSAHKRRSHGAVGQYACPHCSDRFPTFARRTKHLREIHSVQHEYVCKECGKAFFLAGTLSTHIRYKHAKQKRHTCALCPSSYFLRSDLVAHTSVVHGGPHAYTCAQCGKRFLRKNALKVHLRSHTNDRPFACALCKKAFTQKCSLITHSRIHSREPKMEAERMVGLE